MRAPFASLPPQCLNATHRVSLSHYISVSRSLSAPLRPALSLYQCVITTPNLEKLGNEDLVQGPSDIPKISKYG